jgi:hypothetical protein
VAVIVGDWTGERGTEMRVCPQSGGDDGHWSLQRKGKEATAGCVPTSGVPGGPGADGGPWGNRWSETERDDNDS